MEVIDVYALRGRSPTRVQREFGDGKNKNGRIVAGLAAIVSDDYSIHTAFQTKIRPREKLKFELRPAYPGFKR